jgi:hypothetical protein
MHWDPEPMGLTPGGPAGAVATHPGGTLVPLVAGLPIRRAARGRQIAFGGHLYPRVLGRFGAATSSYGLSSSAMLWADPQGRHTALSTIDLPSCQDQGRLDCLGDRAELEPKVRTIAAYGAPNTTAFLAQRRLPPLEPQPPHRACAGR